VRQSLQQQLEARGRLSYSKDLKPILGNPFVVGGIDPRSVTDHKPDNQFVGALKAKDKGKLESIVKEQGAKQEGEKNGAKIYKSQTGSPFAIKDDVLVVAGSKAQLEAALQRRAGDNHLDQAAFDKGLEGLPKAALLRVYANVGGLLRSDPASKDARRIKWVDSLTTLGATTQAADDSLNVDFKLKTKPGLSAADLPVAAGDTAPGIVERPGEVGLALRNPSQLVKFAQSAGQAVNPAGFGQYSAAKSQINQRYKVNIDRDLIGQLEGDTASSVSVDGKFAARAEVKDPAVMKRTLARLAPALPQLAASGGSGRDMKLAKPKNGNGLYSLTMRGGRNAVFGVVGKVFVIANDAASAKGFAAASPTTVGDAKGAVLLKADAEQVANRVLARIGPRLGLGGALGGRLFTGPLGDLNGSLSSTTSGLSGKLTLGLK
jgi:hypothetical protein